jgi:branched-chain amino acid transport system ATP-binding protein
MLEVRDLKVQYGRVTALRGVSLDVHEGEIVSVVGPNGAGKSTLMWAIAGDLRTAGGHITFEGETLLGSSPEDIVRRGIALVPEDRHVFGSLTVAENLQLGMTVRRDRRAAQRELSGLEERFPVLAEQRATPAGRLSGGQQQQLVIARALLSRPRLVLLDEPSLGLDPQNVALLFSIIARLREDGTTVLLVEQNAAQAIRLADRTYVLRTGAVALHGDRDTVLAEENLFDTYLGARKA